MPSSRRCARCRRRPSREASAASDLRHGRNHEPAADWDRALQIQGEMFQETERIGGLDVQLVYFRGFNECRASKWVSEPTALARLMAGVDCRGGHTQIGKVPLPHQGRGGKAKVNAVVYVGDAMEEKIDALCGKAGEIGLLGIPIFMFQEGIDGAVAGAYREIARLTRGAYYRLDGNSAHALRDLLSAVAVYAAGGRQALENHFQEQGRQCDPSPRTAQRAMINFLIAGVIIVGGLWIIRQFSKATPGQASALTRQIGGVACIAGAGFLTLRGQAAIAAPIFVFGLGLMGKSTLFPTGFPWERKSPGQSSRVRTSVIAMELDHDSGRMDGEVLTGPAKGRRLSGLTDAELGSLHRLCASAGDQKPALVRGMARPHEAVLARSLGWQGRRA